MDYPGYLASWNLISLNGAGVLFLAVGIYIVTVARALRSSCHMVGAL